MPRHYSAILTSFLLILILSVSVGAYDFDPYNQKHQAGMRIGGWKNQGDIHVSDTSFSPTQMLATNIGSGSFYAEGFFGYRLSELFMGEISFGIVNRGTVTIDDGNTRDIGNLIIYPILAQIRLYPLGKSETKLQPYLTGGGGLYFGRRSVQFTNSNYYYTGLNEESATRFSYTLGGGFDYPVAESIALEGNIKYMPINYSKQLVTVKNYEATVITIGIKYLFSGKK